MATVNLLSIDWDYFFDIRSDAERMEYFQPICSEDHYLEFIDFAWWVSYSKYEEKLKDIKLLPAIDKIKGCIPQKAAVYVCKSHKHAYEIFKQYVGRKDKVNFLNIDHHPDTSPFFKLEGVHCGNWVSHFMAEQGV